MAQTSFALMTNLGRAKEAAALANATAIEVTHIAIGDGLTVPSGGETALYNEVARKTISGHGTVVGASNVAYFDCYLAAGDGPYTIREAGLYDVEGDLIAIAHYNPPINKPVPESGQTVEGTVRLEVAFSDVANVIIAVDPSMQVALQRLTRLPWIPVMSISLATPPASPAVGDTYLIATSPTGAWTGNAGKVAEYTIAGWSMMTPPDGHGISLPDGRIFERISGGYVEKIALDAQSGKWIYGEDSGAANALVVTLSPAPPSLVAGLTLRIKAAHSNTKGAMLNANGLGFKPVVRRDGTTLLPGDIIAGAVQDYVYDGTSFQMPCATGQLPLTQSVDIYVNPATGSDTLYDGSAATVSGSSGPFQTLTKALSYVSKFTPTTFGVTINLAAGAYTSTTGFATANWAHCNVTITGAGATSIITSSETAGRTLDIQGPNYYTLQNLALGSTSSFSSGFITLTVGQAATVNLAGGITFLGCTSAAFGNFIKCGFGNVNVLGHITLSGSAGFSSNYGGIFVASGGGASVFFASSVVVTISTAITCGVFAQVFNGGIMVVQTPSPMSFVNSGNVTGQRYHSTLNGLINTQGQGASYFPGTVAGTTGSPGSTGQYA